MQDLPLSKPATDPAVASTAEPAIGPTEPPVVSVLIISYNTCEMTLECLRSVRDQTTLPHEVIVVDNNSQDGSAEAIAAEFPEIDLDARKDNLGFAGGNNAAAARAQGEYILLLNPDTVVLDHAIDKLVAFAKAQPQSGIWGGRTLFGDMSLNPSSCWRRMTVWSCFCRMAGLTAIFPKSGLFSSEGYGGWPRDTERDVDIVQGCYLLITRKMWNDLGGFDPAFFMYGEEADLCLRAKKTLGAQPRVTPDSTIIHYGGASEKVRSDQLVKLLTGKMALIDRHFPEWQRPLGRFFFGHFPLTRLIAARTIAALTGRQSIRTTADVWADVWTRRKIWRAGY
jgi:GT2 family glycosyltransferase